MGPIVKERAQNFLLVLSSILVAFIIIGAAEIGVRIATEAPFLGVSRNLFAKDRFKDSIGNNPGVTAIAFGEEAHIDAGGFRVGARAEEKAAGLLPGNPVLVLGDSVAFGAGVPEEKTFVGLLRHALPGRRFVNTAVIGYAIKDYENVFLTLLDRGYSFDRVLLLFCLNDVSPASSEAIRQHLNAFGPKVRSIPLIEEINAFVRERSKLYVVLKGWLTDPRKRYFLADEANYADSASVEAQLQPLVRIAHVAEQRGIPFTVVIVPYAYQMRPEGQPRLGPQNVLSTILRRNRVDFIDIFPMFLKASSPSTDLYLPYDQTHLSLQGHKVLSHLLSGLLRDGASKASLPQSN
jgi:hypothetical protein